MTESNRPDIHMTRAEAEQEFGTPPPEFVTSLHPGPDGYGRARLIIDDDL